MSRSTAISEDRGVEVAFDPSFTTDLAMREKQIQQNYRPVIGIHKWFARRPGTVFRSILLSEFVSGPVSETFWKAHKVKGLIADPFMGGGTPVFEANRLGLNVVGCDINPMAYWVVRQSLASLDVAEFTSAAAEVAADVEASIGNLYRTACKLCHKDADVKYFLWVKTTTCPLCSGETDLFPGYRLAEAERHPRHVIACRSCGELNEFVDVPTVLAPGQCASCRAAVCVEGSVGRKKVTCTRCAGKFPMPTFSAPPAHRLWAIEYNCSECYKGVEGRLFKAPDASDLRRYRSASAELQRVHSSLPLPADSIPPGDETDRLHRWGYRRYIEMFNDRQRLGLGLLLRRIMQVKHSEIRNALLTVFSDSLRYQNMLCRYDTYALKCQDIFSVHGFPVGLVQCENNLLGIPGVGSGSFRHFVEKYSKAKAYCRAPFETRHDGKRKVVVPVLGESIAAELVSAPPVATQSGGKQAYLVNAPSHLVPLPPNSLDGVFTDPPYFDNVQYAELMDFCFVWLRQALGSTVPEFKVTTTRSSEELTGNQTLGRGLEHFTAGLSRVFAHFAAALKPKAPFVFTYHHNDPEAYLPLIVAILDAGLTCTATLPAAAEMSASLHIARTGSSVLDSIFVCRPVNAKRTRKKGTQMTFTFCIEAECTAALERDAKAMTDAGLTISAGDARCLLAGHLARLSIVSLVEEWDPELPLTLRLERARCRVRELLAAVQTEAVLGRFAGRGAAMARVARARKHA